MVTLQEHLFERILCISADREKKKGFSDGLFLDCSHLPPSVSFSLYVFVRFSPTRLSLFPTLSLSFALLSITHQSLKGAGGGLKPGWYV